MMEKPNFLFIMADQLSAHALPMYGHPVVKAANLDRISQDGVIFNNCHCNFPLCAPSRTSIMTGQLCSKVGAYDNATEFPASIPTFVHYLRELSYKTCLSGKMHFVGPDQLHGFEERLTPEIYPSDFIWTPNWQADTTFNDLRSVRQAGVCTRSMQVDYDEEVAYQGVKKIYDFARDKKENPFFLTVSFTHPHDPYITLDKYWNVYKDEVIDLPKRPDLPSSQLDDFSRRLKSHYGIEGQPLTDNEIRNARHAYYSNITYLDDKIGQLIEALTKTGFIENTIVVFTADHGDMLGEKGLWYKKAFFDESVRVPLIIYAPKRYPAKRISKIVSLVDLFPTFVDMAGGTVDKNVVPIDGTSLLKLLSGDGLDWPDCALVEMLAEGVRMPCVMIREGDYKYWYSADGNQVLLNMATDSSELKNLSTSPEMKTIVNRFQEKVQKIWDLDCLTKKILQSQKQRKIVQRALDEGRKTTWDFLHTPDPSQRFIRTNEWWFDVETRYLLRKSKQGSE